MENLFVGDGENKIKIIVNEQKIKRVGYEDENIVERSRKSDIERRIREKIRDIIDENIEIIEQQYDVDIKNINSYKPLLVKFFKKGNNFKDLLIKLSDLKRDFETLDSKEYTFEEFVEQTLHSLEMSKIGAEKDRRNLVKEHVENFGKFIQKKLNKD